MGEKSYLALKALHVIGVILFVGNLLVTALVKTLADRTREPAVVAFAQRLVAVTDVAFTGCGAALVALTGILMIVPYEVEFWKLGWLMSGIGLFLVSGLVWVFLLLPLQLKQSRLARQFVRSGEIPAEYWRLGRLWMAYGTIATILPLINVFLMVLKPR